MKIKDKNRFDSKIMPEPNTGCWFWVGSLDQDGYGLFKIGGVMHRAHRLSYRQYKGVVPKKMLVCHNCDTPGCVNPDHLFLGTHQDNTNDKMNKNRQPIGETHGAAKINRVTAQIIRETYKSGFKQQDIAKYFKLGQTHISRIITNQVWV